MHLIILNNAFKESTVLKALLSVVENRFDSVSIVFPKEFNAGSLYAGDRVSLVCQKKADALLVAPRLLWELCRPVSFRDWRRAAAFSAPPTSSIMPRLF